MKTSSALFAFMFCILVYSCTYSIQKDATILPIFADNGATIDSLQAHYQCELIEYENWKVGKPEDSCLTVAFINSTKVPFSNIKDSNSHPLEDIAASIKASLSNWEQYKSYYIVFVTKMVIDGEVVKSHTLGMEVDSDEL